MRIYTDSHGQRWTVTDEQYVSERLRRRIAWEQAEQALKEAKTAAANAKRDLIDWCADPSSVEGSERIYLGDGYEAKVTKSLNYSFIKDSSGRIDRTQVTACLQYLYSIGVNVDALVNWSPSLSKSAYEALTDEQRQVIDSVVVTDFATPKLEIVKSSEKPTL